MTAYTCSRCDRTEEWQRKSLFEGVHMVNGSKSELKYTGTFVLCPECESLLSEWLQ